MKKIGYLMGMLMVVMLLSGCMGLGGSDNGGENEESTGDNVELVSLEDVRTSVDLAEELSSEIYSDMSLTDLKVEFASIESRVSENAFENRFDLENAKVARDFQLPYIVEDYSQDNVFLEYLDGMETYNVLVVATIHYTYDGEANVGHISDPLRTNVMLRLEFNKESHLVEDMKLYW